MAWGPSPPTVTVHVPAPFSLMTLIPLQDAPERQGGGGGHQTRQGPGGGEGHVLGEGWAAGVGGRSVPLGGPALHQPGSHPTPGPSLPAAAEGVPGEAAEGPQDQPAQVGCVVPHCPLPHPAGVIHSGL